jgi:hypothetical protein
MLSGVVADKECSFVNGGIGYSGAQSARGLRKIVYV